MTLGIQDISTYLPAESIDNLEQADRFDADRSFVENKIGVSRLPRFSEADSVTSAGVAACQTLAEKAGIDITTLDCLVVCTQNPDGGGLPHNSAMIHGALDIDEGCACFDIGLGCSGYVYGLSIIKAFMQANGMRKGVLLTCDPYSRILDPQDKSTSLLFGDAATATLMSDTPRYVEIGSHFATRGSAGAALEKQHDKLFMNGRAVFNFALMDVPKQIGMAIERASLAKEDIDLFVLHQGSRFMLENTVKRAGILASKAPIELRETGNTVSSSIPFVLQKHLGDEPGRVLMSGFGVGLSWATTIYERC